MQHDTVCTADDNVQTVAAVAELNMTHLVTFRAKLGDSDTRTQIVQSSR
jgi:hypothetical protein